jgi:hypothetical protein
MLMLLACKEEAPPAKEAGPVDTADTGDTAVKPPDVELGDPYMAVAAATDSLSSTCTVSVSVDAGGEQVLSLTLDADGRDWTGGGLTGGTQYTAESSVTGCANNPESLTSGTFSGQEGYIFVFSFNGVRQSFNAIQQEVDFTSGQALVTFAEDTTLDTVEALASTASATATLQSGTTYLFTFAEALPVASVLSTCSSSEAYASGEPVWIEEPTWW